MCKNKLAQRDKGKTKDYDSWYAYGRRQGLNKITSKKIIIVPGMIGNECLPIEIDISNLITTYGQLVFTSGFIVPNDGESCNKLLDDNFRDDIISDDEEKIKDGLFHQLFNPVRWTQSMEFMSEKKLNIFLEIGPGKVLTSLSKRINRDSKNISIDSMESIENFKEIS